MPRTTADAVKLICKVKPGVDLTPFIESANIQVTDLCSDSGYRDTRLELIERWLSAYYLCIRYPRAIQESVEGVSVQYEGRVATGFAVNKYGQAAMGFDPAGNLKAASEKRKIKGSVTQLGGNLTCEEERWI